MKTLLDKLLIDAPVVVLDTETTGLYPGLGHRVVELGAIRLEPQAGESWQVTGQISQLVNPQRLMDPAASRVNGIYDHHLAQQPPFAAVIDELFALLDGAVVVAHNARFDAEFIGMEFFIHRLDSRRSPFPAQLPNPWLCTLELARRHFYFGRNTLSHVARQLGVRVGQSHRALNDVYTTAEVLKKMSRLLARQRLESIGALLQAQGGAIYAGPPPSVELPPLVQQAIDEGHRLQLRYKAKAGLSERIITPRYPTHFQGHDYLIVFCHLQDELRAFRLDRIQDAVLAPADA